MTDHREPCKSEGSIKLVRGYSIIIKTLAEDKGPGKWERAFLMC